MALNALITGALWALFATLALSGCAALSPAPRAADLAERLAAFPTRDLDLEAPASIYWNGHQVPYIVAESDQDAPYLLGLVHAHLRLGQMAVARHLAHGRIAELGGPFFSDIDASLRVLGYGRAADPVLAAMPEASRTWVERFVQGINTYQERAAELPVEFGFLGLEREPWRPRDVIALGRLAGTDVNWIKWFGLLERRDHPDWPRLWRRVLAQGAASPVSFGADSGPVPAATTARGPGTGGPAKADRPGGGADALVALLQGYARTGSNSLAVGGKRAAGDAALIASDPHLGLFLPNLWLIAGLHSPSYRVVGLMAPGLPVFAIGRNPWVAWGGTNLHGAASDLVDVTDLAEAGALPRERTRIPVRAWPDREFEYRVSPYGPVLSDAPLFPEQEDRVLALRWVGHGRSDEISAFLGVARARDWEQFRGALETFAVPPQNMLYADAAGNIGQVLAARLPRRPAELPEELAVSPAQSDGWWQTMLSTADLPAALNPARGYLASANNRPTATPYPIGYFYGAPERVRRMEDWIGGREGVKVEDLKGLQRDVYSAASAELRDRLLAYVNDPAPAAREAVERLRAWDGHYRAESAGALVLEVLVAHLVERLEADSPVEVEAGYYRRRGRLRTVLPELLERVEAERVAGWVVTGLGRAAERLHAEETWGAVHRLRLDHLLARVPVLGRRYRGVDLPAGGSFETVMKTAHPILEEVEPHRSFYGSQSRHVSDLSDPNANWFVLLGGQDGWVDSSTWLDQVDLWRRGEYLQMPLDPARVRAEFPRVMALEPAP